MPEEAAAIAGTSGGLTGEPLSCVTCRSRKVRCDKVKPVCTRCVGVNSNCVYPESRRKPAFKRRNVKELEERLAQVEDLLRQNTGQGRDIAAATSSGSGLASDAEGLTSETVGIDNFEIPVTDDVFFQGIDYDVADVPMDDSAFTFSHEGSTPYNGAPSAQPPNNPNRSAFGNELIDIGGVFEALPPFEVMEDLNRLYFERQQQFGPVVHPGRYWHAFYSPPHMRPPMCLQYAMWALTSYGDPKYNAYHSVFYQRARRYIDIDEMKGNGEYFITVAHAQTWCILATYEAKSMMFTRASMSCARGVRLTAMMGLHRLDSPPDESSPTLAPARDWAELEERRRVFWGIFCIDSHCSISTGWPHLIDITEVTTHIPATEAAFHNGEPLQTCTISDAIKGEYSYSSFAASVVVCHLFNLILKHAHRPKENDSPDNYEYGEYWKRHREIDNTLSNAFMFLPESFRVPENNHEPTAVSTNLNLHAAIICLHHAALERIETYDLPEPIKRISQDRLRAAAQEIVNIMKVTSHMNSSPRTPLAALSLFCAASVYMYFCKESSSSSAPTNADNLDFMLSAMEAIGRKHILTRSFLHQAVLDIEQNGVQDIVQLPRVARLRRQRLGDPGSHNVPLLARSRMSRHSEAQPPLPGLPIRRGGTNPLDSMPLLSSTVSWPEPTTTINSLGVAVSLSLSSSSVGIGSDDPDGSGGGRRHTLKRQRIATTTVSNPPPLQTDSSTPSSLPFPYPSIHFSHPPTNHDPAPLFHQDDLTDNNNERNRMGVTIASGILGNRSPRPFVTAGRETRTSSKGGMGSWELAGLCVSAMAEQWGGNNAVPNDSDSGDAVPTTQFAYSVDVDYGWEDVHTMPDIDGTPAAAGRAHIGDNQGANVPGQPDVG